MLYSINYLEHISEYVSIEADWALWSDWCLSSSILGGMLFLLINYQSFQEKGEGEEIKKPDIQNINIYVITIVKG